MRRALFCFALMLLPATAFAAEGKWTAEMQEDEGGPVMVASVSGVPVGDLTPVLSLMCAGTEGINLRYEMATDGAEPGTENDFVLKTDKVEVSKHMALEDMDGAFAAYFQPTDPAIDLLKTGRELVISETGSKNPPQSFALAGSTKAIETLLRTCE